MVAERYDGMEGLVGGVGKFIGNLNLYGFYFGSHLYASNTCTLSLSGTDAQYTGSLRTELELSQNELV